MGSKPFSSTKEQVYEAALKIAKERRAYGITVDSAAENQVKDIEQMKRRMREFVSAN